MTTNHRGPVKLNRRAMLRAAGGIAIGLPFLEGLPERSAWAQGQEPVFGFMIVAACGVVGKNFFPNATGALTVDGLRSSGKSVAALADHAANLLFVKNVNFPTPGPTGCGHVQGLVQALTGRSPNGGDRNATAQGVSADVQIAQAVNDGADPLTLYAGDKRNGYVVERISFKGAGSGQVRSADDNPYTLYNKLVTGGAIGTGGGGPSVTDELLASRKSVNDLVRAELNSLKSRPELSMEDRLRLDQHFQCIRDAENTMGGMAAACSATGLSQSKIDALRTGFAFTTSNGMIEEIVKLHFELVALSFACNFNRIATLQWGDATDKTMYGVPSNNGLKWPFHYLSHRVQSDASSGSNPTAESAHAEIDALRMQTLAYGLGQFASRGLANKAYVLWTNHIADGPTHNMRNVPHIIWGNGGGHLKQGQYVDAGNVNNNRLLTTLVSASLRDTGMAVENFAGASGQLAAIRA